MIKFITKSDYGEYMSGRDQVVLEIFKEHNVKSQSQEWHLGSPQKRYVFDLVYGDLLDGHVKNRNILDIGAGMNGAMQRIAENNTYCVVDIMQQPAFGNVRYLQSAWEVLNGQGTVDWDIVICNDLFPNVDQRLLMFLDKFLPHCREIRMSLTYFNHPTWYQAKRVGGDEMLTMLQWNGLNVAEVLGENWGDKVDSDVMSGFTSNESIFPNGRQVCVIHLPGGAT